MYLAKSTPFYFSPLLYHNTSFLYKNSPTSRKQSGKSTTKTSLFLASPNLSYQTRISSNKLKINMSSTSRAWMVAASIAVVETLKDQGVCRWNCALRSVQQRAKSNIRRTCSQAKKLSAPTSSALSEKLTADTKTKQSEESLRTVMYLSCWGPN